MKALFLIDFFNWYAILPPVESPIKTILSNSLFIFLEINFFEYVSISSKILLLGFHSIHSILLKYFLSILSLKDFLDEFNP